MNKLHVITTALLATFIVKTKFIKPLIFVLPLSLMACAGSTSVSFLCENEDLQIFVNNEYVGTGLVSYTAPKGVTTAEVECKKNGITIFSKNYYIKGYNNALFDIKVPDYNSYSSDKQIHSK